MSQQAGAGAAAQRLQKELKELIMSDVDGISAFPDNDDLFNWIGTVQGVEGTPYEDLEFQLRLKFSDNYPYQPPEVTFITPCFHPNIDVHGAICVDILKEKWSPVQSASSILLSIQNLLNDPFNDSALNTTAADMWGKGPEYRKYADKRKSKKRKEKEEDNKKKITEREWRPFRQSMTLWIVDCLFFLHKSWGHLLVAIIFVLSTLCTLLWCLYPIIAVLWSSCVGGLVKVLVVTTRTLLSSSGWALENTLPHRITCAALLLLFTISKHFYTFSVLFLNIYYNYFYYCFVAWIFQVIANGCLFETNPDHGVVKPSEKGSFKLSSTDQSEAGSSGSPLPEKLLFLLKLSPLHH
eukprot:gene3879-2751_t